MADLLEEVSEYHGTDVIRAGAYFHAVLENIHPFSDGNGRTGRTLLNYYLMTHNHPPLIVYDQDKRLYYECLEKYDAEETIAPLTEFLKYETEKTWEKTGTGRKRKPEKRSGGNPVKKNENRIEPSDHPLGQSEPLPQGLFLFAVKGGFKMKKHFKRPLSLLLAILLCIGMLPVSASAADLTGSMSMIDIKGRDHALSSSCPPHSAGTPARNTPCCGSPIPVPARRKPLTAWNWESPHIIRSSISPPPTTLSFPRSRRSSSTPY